MRTAIFRTAIVGLLAFGVASADAATLPLTPRPDSTVIVRVIDRPEMRSYQPYSGLQFGFRPEPRSMPGTGPQRPRVIMPTPIAPLIEYGKTPNPYSAQWYTYCSEKFASFEPSTGFYTGFSGRRRLCR